MPIQCGRNVFWHSLKKERLDAAGMKALWLPLARTSSDGASFFTWLACLASRLPLVSERLLWDAEQTQTPLKSLDRALSYLMRWSCTIYILRTYAYCTISANIFVRTLFKSKMWEHLWAVITKQGWQLFPSLIQSKTFFLSTRLWNVNGTGHFQKLVLFAIPKGSWQGYR